MGLSAIGVPTAPENVGVGNMLKTFTSNPGVGGEWTVFLGHSAELSLPTDFNDDGRRSALRDMPEVGVKIAWYRRRIPIQPNVV